MPLRAGSGKTSIFEGRSSSALNDSSSSEPSEPGLVQLVSQGLYDLLEDKLIATGAVLDVLLTPSCMTQLLSKKCCFAFARFVSSTKASTGLCIMWVYTACSISRDCAMRATTWNAAFCKSETCFLVPHCGTLLKVTGLLPGGGHTRPGDLSTLWTARMWSCSMRPAVTFLDQVMPRIGSLRQKSADCHCVMSSWTFETCSATPAHCMLFLVRPVANRPWT